MQMTKLYNPDTVYKQESALYCVLSSLTQFYDGVNSGLTSSQLILKHHLSLNQNLVIFS